MWELYFYYGALSAYVMALVMYLSFAALRRPVLVGRGELAYTIGFIFNTLALVIRWFAMGTALGSKFDFLLCLAWSMALGLQILSWKYRYKALGVFVMPLILGLYLYSTTLFGAAAAVSPVASSSWLTIHLAMAVFGYGTLGVAFGLACPRILDGRWKMAMSTPVREATDALLSQVLTLGFGFLTLMIITGAIWSLTANAWVLTWNPTQTWPLITWLIYGATIHTAFSSKTKGKAVAWLSALGFLCVLATVLGGNLLIS